MLPGCRDWCKIQDRSCKCLSPDFWSTLDNYQWTQNWGKSSAAAAWRARASDPPLIFPQYSLTLSSQRFGLRVPAHTWPNVKRRLWALLRLWLVNEPPLRRLIGPLKPRKKYLPSFPCFTKTFSVGHVENIVNQSVFQNKDKTHHRQKLRWK